MLFLLILFAVCCMIFVTNSGIGFSPDSVNYLNAAQNLREGNGLTLTWFQAEPQLMQKFPPGYAVLLATVAANLSAIRLLHVIIFALNLSTIVFILYTVIASC